MRLGRSRSQAGPRGIEQERQSVIERTIGTYGAYARSGYSTRWSGQQSGTHLARRELTAWLAQTLRPATAGTVVDLGCGNGNLAITLEQAGCRPLRYIGVDLLPERIHAAEESVPWGEFLVASADRIPIPDGVAHAVAAVTLFSSIPEPWFQGLVAAEIGRILRPGGLLVIYDLRYPSLNRAVVPVREADLRRLFPGWGLTTTSMTLLPPLARRWIGAGHRRYRALSSIPILRSHSAAVLRKPDGVGVGPSDRG